MEQNIMKLKFLFGHLYMFMYLEQARQDMPENTWYKICNQMGGTWEEFDYLSVIPRKPRESLGYGRVLQFCEEIRFKKL